MRKVKINITTEQGELLDTMEITQEEFNEVMNSKKTMPLICLRNEITDVIFHEADKYFAREVSK